MSTASGSDKIVNSQSWYLQKSVATSTCYPSVSGKVQGSDFASAFWFRKQACYIIQNRGVINWKSSSPQVSHKKHQTRMNELNSAESMMSHGCGNRERTLETIKPTGQVIT